MRQGVNDVVDADANAERGILLSSFFADKGRAVYETLTSRGEPGGTVHSIAGPDLPKSSIRPVNQPLSSISNVECAGFRKEELLRTA